MPPLGDFIGKWLDLIKPIAEQFVDDGSMSASERQTAFERISVGNSIKNLRSFPYIADLEKNKKIALHGAWFDIKTGELWIMDHKTGEFSRPQ